jgi:hypothetical protein
MATARTERRIFQELSDLLTSSPSQEQLLYYRPSKVLQQRLHRLLARQGEGTLTYEQQRELDEFLHAEMLMGLVKAKLNACKGVRS